MNAEEKILSILQDMQEDITGIKSDVTGLKSDVAELKSDVAELKSNVTKLNKEVSVLKKDVAELKRNAFNVDRELNFIKEKIGSLENGLVENTNITKALKTSHEFLNAKLDGLLIEKAGRKQVSDLQESLANIFTDAGKKLQVQSILPEG